MHGLSWNRAAAAALAALLAAAPGVRADDGEDGPSSDDLLVMRGGRGWTGWWFVNRRSLLDVSYRAGLSAAGVAPPDAAARGRARDALLEWLRSHEELIRSEAALALARLGDARDIVTLSDLVDERYMFATRRTHRMAALGLGLLPAGDAEQSARARRSLLAAIDDARGKHDQFAYFWANCSYALAMRNDVAALPRLLDIRRKGLAAADMQSSLHADVLSAICYTAAALGGETALPEVIESLRGRKAPDGGSKTPAWSACHALARIGGPAARRVLLETAKDEEDHLRRGAIASLGSVAGAKDDEVAAVLRSALADDVDKGCRDMAAVALGRTGHASAGPTLIAALSTAPAEDRQFVALGLGLLGRATGDAAVRDALLSAIREGSTQEAELSALALACGLANVDAARPRLAELAASSKAPAVAAYAAFALGLVGAGPDERKVLREVVTRRDAFTASREAALALGLLRDRSIVAQLRDALGVRSAADIDRATAAICLGRVGDDTDIDFLLGVLAEPDMSGQLRACVINALGFLLDRSEGAALGRLTADSMTYGLVRSGQIQAIQDIQHLLD